VAQIFKMKNNDNLLGVIETILKWKKPILRVILIATLGTAAIAFLFLPNYYKSTTTFYVASPDLFKPEQVFGTSNKDMDYYGSENDVDRVLTIAQSGELSDFLIKKFDLYKRYEIDTSKEDAPYKVREQLDKLLEIKKTKLNAVELSIEDRDKKITADMANTAREKIDEIAQRLIRETQLKLIQAYESSFIEKEKTLLGMGDTLARLRQNYGVIDPDKQTEAVTKSVVDAEANYYRSKAKWESLKANPSVSADTLAQLEGNVKGYEEELKRGNEMLKRYNSGFNSVSALKEYYEKERDQISKDKQRFLQLRIAYGTKISALVLIESGRVPIVKSRPKRSIIIFSAALISLIFSVLGVILLENYRAEA
jgi:tyrosine-protein kinase Etk/Wzc